jgi:hypothetical protein
MEVEYQARGVTVRDAGGFQVDLEHVRATAGEWKDGFVGPDIGEPNP